MYIYILYKLIYIYIYNINSIACVCYLMIADNIYLHSCIKRNLRNFIEILTVMSCRKHGF